jgi:hypothetical protein
MEIVENAARYVSIADFRYSISDKNDEGGNLSSNFSVNSPYLFVQSAAVTDDPINLDITSPEFTSFMEMLKGLDYYDFLNTEIQAVEENPEEESEEETVLEEEETDEPEPLPLNENEETPLTEESGTEPSGNTSIFPTQ